MLSSIARSPYICRICRARLISLRLVPPSTFRMRTLSTSTRFHTAYNPQGGPQTPQPPPDDYDSIETASAVSSILAGHLAQAEGQKRKKAVSNKQKQTEAEVLNAEQADRRTRWAELGMRQVVVDTMIRAFPNVVRPNILQRRLISALGRGYSVIVNCTPGSGKSFAIAAWLLSLERSLTDFEPEARKGSRREPSTTALVLAPNIDLVRQYYTYVSEMLYEAGNPEITENISVFVQALYRSKDEEAAQIEVLRQNPRPHIVIATPTILLDILSQEGYRDLIDYMNLKTIVLEEMDTVLHADIAPVEPTAEHLEGQIPDEDSKADMRKTNKDPTVILLDYIFEARKAYRLNKGQRPRQPQLVVPTAVIGRQKMRRLIETHHPLWLDGENRPGFSALTGKARTTAASNVLSIAGPDRDKNKSLPRLVPETISHHIVAYNPITKVLRDAPLPIYEDAQSLAAALTHQVQFERDLESDLSDALRTNNVEQIVNIVDSYQHLAPEIARRGYPTRIAVDILQKLLQHDNYPTNVFVSLSENASQSDFLGECSRRGITARYLRADEWNEHGPYPLGRTDLVVGGGEPFPQSGCTVWVTNYHACRGTDYPGVNHIYVLHRIDKARELITYSGRVGRWPFTAIEELRDPRSMGKDNRPRAKAVSVLLESKERPEGGYAVIRTDGSEGEAWAWEREALRLGKIGADFVEYIGQPETAAEMKQEMEQEMQEDDGEVMIEVEQDLDLDLRQEPEPEQQLDSRQDLGHGQEQ